MFAFGGRSQATRSRLAKAISYASATQTLTFLFTDIEGSTTLLERLGQDAYAGVLADHHGLIRAAIGGHEGREVDTQGDGFFAVFPSAANCAAAAMQMQAGIAEHPWPAGEPVRVRMGMHSGEAAETSTGLVGVDVHRAARVAAVAWGGQILLSETAAALVRDSLADGASMRDLGLHRLKDLSRPQRIFQLDAAGLEAAFPPLRSLDNPELANNLPAQSASFVGRDRELEQVRGLVGSSRLVTLTGAGGCGKTRLALEVAGELLEATRGGVWLVSLDAVADDDAVSATIAGTLGINGQQGRSDLDTLLDILASQSVLIVLDNCEHLIASCATVADAILSRCPKVRVVATSREPLGIAGETVYRVPSLSLPSQEDDDLGALARSDAVVLFLERARAQGAELVLDRRSAPLIASTCRRLDGMPLAIELAAARLRSLSLSELHGLLDQRFRLLTGGSRTALERQQTLRATVEWSYSLLSEPERSLLRRLSVFAGSFERGAAAAVCAYGEIGELDVTDLLGSLVDKSLVVADHEQGGLRYRLLETIRQFAAERLVELDERDAASIADAHVEYFLAVAESAAADLRGPDPAAWFAQLDADYPNLRRAIERVADDPRKTAIVLRFAVALAYYWFTRARRSEALALVRPALERAEADVEPDLHVRALVLACGFAFTTDARTALRLAQQAAEEARALGDRGLETQAMMALAGARRYAGEEEAAYRLAQQSLEQARLSDDDRLLAECLLINIICGQEIDPERTEALHLEGVASAERSGNLLLTHDLHMLAGERALEAGDLSGAREQLDRAAEVGRVFGAASWYVTLPLALLLLAEGERDQAIVLFRSTIRATHRVGDRARLAYALLGVACVAADQSEWERAAQLHGAAQAVSELAGPSWVRWDQLRRRSIESLRASLGEARFERAYAAGRGLGVDGTVELALSGSRPASPVSA